MGTRFLICSQHVDPIPIWIHQLSRAFSEMNSMLNPFNWPVKIRFLQALLHCGKRVWNRMDSLWQTCHELP